MHNQFAHVIYLALWRLASRYLRSFWTKAKSTQHRKVTRLNFSRLHVLSVVIFLVGAEVAASSSRNEAVHDFSAMSFTRTDIVIRAGATLASTLGALGVSPQERHSTATALGKQLDLRCLPVGQKLTAWTHPSEHGEDEVLCLARLELVPKTDQLLVVEHERTGGYFVRERTLAHQNRLEMVEGTIESSLYKAARERGVPSAIVERTFLLLGHVIDFQRDLHPDDRFALAFEIFRDERGGTEHPGALIYASLERRGVPLQIYRHETSDGRTGYFDENGNSLETTLMRTPVDGARLTSRFGQRRHPILGGVRKHRGLDFGASPGTPIYAAGDGVVVRRGRNSGFGRFVRIRHSRKLETAYAHLRGYARRVPLGARVTQGQVIGYVGSSGLATGPNLHYEVYRHGLSVVPLTLDLPSNQTLVGEERLRFDATKSTLRKRLCDAQGKCPQRPQEREDEALHQVAQAISESNRGRDRSDAAAMPAPADFNRKVGN